MNTRFKLAAAVALSAGIPAAPALAHHSFAMFDANQTFAVDAVVTELQWTNPHCWLEVMVPGGKGAHRNYTRLSLEMNALSGLRRAGWKPTTVKPGDKVKISYHPMRDGTAAGQLLSVTLPDGSSLRGQ